MSFENRLMRINIVQQIVMIIRNSTNKHIRLERITKKFQKKRELKPRHFKLYVGQSIPMLSSYYVLF